VSQTRISISVVFEFVHMFDFMYLLQVKIQKDSEVRLKIIGTRVDATEIVSFCASFDTTIHAIAPSFCRHLLVTIIWSPSSVSLPTLCRKVYMVPF